MNQTQIAAPRFEKAKEKGEVLRKAGYHQPGIERHTRSCGCSLTTEKGAYRDVSVEMPDGTVAHYYHQSPVVVVSEDGRRARVDSCGWKTSTTKERITSHLPPGWRVRQEDFEWYVITPDGEVLDFEDGMVLNID